MNRAPTANENILLINIFKWIGLALLTGLLTGAVVGSFLIVLFAATDFVAALPDWRYGLIPLGLLASLYSIKIFAPAAAGHGTDKVIAAIHYKAARIPFMVVPIKIISTIFTLGSGAVVGTEGPSVQVGGALMSKVSDILNLDDRERKKLVICGVSAALASVFGAPLAGAVFGVEVLFVGELFYTALLPAVISGITAYKICSELGVPYFVPAVTVPAADFSMLGWSLLAALFFGIVSICHITIMNKTMSIFKKSGVSDWGKSLIAATIILTVVAFGGKEYLGMGEKGLNLVLSGTPIVWYAILLKSFLLGTTLSGGGSGGVLTPTFYIGAVAGGVFASIFGLDVGFFGALGFVGCVAGCVNTPIAAIFLAIELFGALMAPFAGLVCITAYMVSGARSLYPTQILLRPKSDAFVLADPSNTESWNVTPRKE